MSDRHTEATVFAALVVGAVAKLAFGSITRRNRRRMMVHVGRVTQLNCYPVKSCRGTSVDRGYCTAVGLQIGKVTDRHWLVARSNGDFITQRQSLRMALVQVTINENDLTFNAPGMPALTIPVDMVPDRSKVTKCRVWEDRLEGMDCGDDAAFWFSTFLQMPNLRLLFSAPGLQRRELTWTNKPWGNPALPGDQSVFSDYCGYLVATEESLAFVNDHLKSPVPMKRFRPSIVISGSPSFDEDNWQEIQIGGSATFRMLDPCTRCIMTTIDEDLAERDPNSEPLETLRTLRCFPEYGKAPLFGVNATIDIPGVIRVGDPVYALRK